MIKSARENRLEISDCLPKEGGRRYKMLGNSPKISIITVVLNSVSTIERTIRSVIKQKCKGIEYILIDGGSTDGSLDLIRAYDDQIDYWVSECDEGIYHAITKGIRASSGEWIYVLGSDDILLIDPVQISSMFTDKYGVYYGDVLLKSCNKRYAGKFNALKLLLKNIPNQATFYPRHVFDEYGFETRFPYLADYALNLELYADRRFRFHYLPVTIAEYNDLSGVSSSFTDQTFKMEKNRLVKSYFPYLFPFYAALKRLAACYDTSRFF